MGIIRSIDINCHHRGKITKFGFACHVRRSTNSVGYEPEEIYEKSKRNTGVSIELKFDEKLQIKIDYF